MNDHALARLAHAYDAVLDRIGGNMPQLPQTDGDRLAFLDGQRAYIEIGPVREGGVISFEDGAWEVMKWNGAKYTVRAKCSTLKEAIDCFANPHCEMPENER